MMMISNTSTQSETTYQVNHAETMQTSLCHGRMLRGANKGCMKHIRAIKTSHHTGNVGSISIYSSRSGTACMEPSWHTNLPLVPHVSSFTLQASPSLTVAAAEQTVSLLLRGFTTKRLLVTIIKMSARTVCPRMKHGSKQTICRLRMLPNFYTAGQVMCVCYTSSKSVRANLLTFAVLGHQVRQSFSGGAANRHGLCAHAQQQKYI
eukprot:1930207-Amphidinium_carterae.1